MTIIKQSLLTTLTHTGLVLLLFVIACLTACSDEAWDGLQEGAAVPAFKLQGADGRIITADSLRGKPSLIVFFNTGCKDCQHELPVVQQIYDTYKYDINILTVARDESDTEVNSYWQQQRMTMPYYTQQGSDMYHLFASSGVPRIYLVDAKGVILSAFDDSNMPDYATLSRCIDDCLDADDGYVTVSVKASVTASRALGTTVDYPYYEYSVNRLYIYFYDADSRQLVKQASVYNLTKLNDRPGATYDISYLCEAIHLRAGRYDVFCIANTDYPPVDIVSEDDFLNTTDNITYQTGIMANSSDNGIIMTNNASDNMGVDLSDSKRHVINIDMERVLAKVQLGCSSPNYELKHDGATYAEINITNYQFVNLNTSFYLFRHTATLHSLTQPSRFSYPDNYESDADIEAHGSYVIDPLFFDKTNDAANYSRVAACYQNPYVSFGAKRMSSMPAPGNVASAYILENTCYSASQTNGYSTGIVFKAAVHPLCVYTYNTSSKEIISETRSEYWPDKLYFWNYRFYNSLHTLNIASGMNIDELRKYTDAELLAYGVKQVDFNMGVYETYYTYWIRHNTAADTPVMKYSIVRNNFYHLIVTGISGIGNSTIYPDPSRDNDNNSYTDDITIQ